MSIFMKKDHPTMFYTMHDQCNISHDDLENMLICPDLP